MKTRSSRKENAAAGGPDTNLKETANENDSLSKIIAHFEVVRERSARGACHRCGVVGVALIASKNGLSRLCLQCSSARIFAERLAPPKEDQEHGPEPDPDLARGRCVRLFSCFWCDQLFSARFMSSALILCKGCLRELRNPTGRCSSRDIEKLALCLSRFLRRWSR